MLILCHILCICFELPGQSWVVVTEMMSMSLKYLLSGPVRKGLPTHGLKQQWYISSHNPGCWETGHFFCWSHLNYSNSCHRLIAWLGLKAWDTFSQVSGSGDWHPHSPRTWPLSPRKVIWDSSQHCGHGVLRRQEQKCKASEGPICGIHPKVAFSSSSLGHSKSLSQPRFKC